MEEQEYRPLVLNLLSKCQYPVLRDFVVVDIWFKMIPPIHHILSEESVQTLDRRYVNPLDVWKSKLDPFRLTYLSNASNDPHTFHLHECDELDTKSFHLQCRRVKITRSVVDRTMQHTSVSFEEELCLFWGLLNFNLPKVAPLIDMDDISSTRCLPQFINLWVYHYDTYCFRPSEIVNQPLKSHFGPPDDKGVIPVRVVRGHLAPCMSSTILLSLNNDLDVSLPTTTNNNNAPYTLHYVEKGNVLIPLAYNPLENPLIVV